MTIPTIKKCDLATVADNSVVLVSSNDKKCSDKSEDRKYACSCCQK